MITDSGNGLSHCRLLVTEKHFVQGFGGTPESVLLLANHLKRLDICVDVLSSEGFLSDVGGLEALPVPGDAAFVQDYRVEARDYAGALIAGSWNPVAVGVAIRARRAGVPLSYAPKGNLCAIEFVRPRDLKKIVYLATVESIPLVLSRRIIFSSVLERDSAVLPSTFIRRKQVVIAELFKTPPNVHRNSEPVLHGTSEPKSIGFMAEISPRKGLLELVQGFLHWCQRTDVDPLPTLRVAGDVRPGSERYLERSKQITEDHPFGNLVTWEPAKRGHVRSEFYRQIDVFVCPSKFESFGLTPLEALWEGTPVLCGPRVGSLQYFSQGPGLQVFKDLRAASIADALESTFGEFTSVKANVEVLKKRIAEAFAADEVLGDFVSALFGSKTGKT